MLLLGQVDDAETPFADLFQKLVGANDGAGLFNVSLMKCGSGSECRFVEQTAGIAMRREQSFHTLAQLRVIATNLVQERWPLVWSVGFNRLEEKLFGGLWH